MLSKSSMEVPYFTPAPLDEKTEWVAFPVLVTYKKESYRQAYEAGKKIVSDLMTATSQQIDERSEIVAEPFDEQSKELKTTMEFAKLNNDCIAYFYNYVLLKFRPGIVFWDKMEIITGMLDEINQFAKHHQSNKQIDIKLSDL